MNSNVSGDMTGPPAGEPGRPTATRSTRLNRLRGIAIILVSLAVAAGCARVVSGTGTPAAAGGSGSTPSFPSVSRSATGSRSGTASTSATASTSGRPSASASPVNVACPTINDTAAGISYSCIDPKMKSDPVSGYTANVDLETEPNWAMSQSSLTVDALDADSMAESVETALDDFVSDFYPEGSVPKATSAKPTTISGKTALLVIGTITIDKSDPDYATLKANTDRLEAVSVLKGDGTAALLIMAVPDTNQAQWPTMDTVATSAKLI